MLLERSFPQALLGLEKEGWKVEAYTLSGEVALGFRISRGDTRLFVATYGVRAKCWGLGRGFHVKYKPKQQPRTKHWDSDVHEQDLLRWIRTL